MLGSGFRAKAVWILLPQWRINQMAQNMDIEMEARFVKGLQG